MNLRDVSNVTISYSILFHLTEMIFLMSLVYFLPPVDSLERVLS